MKKIALFFTMVFLIILYNVSDAQLISIETYHWAKPTSGSKVDHYVVEYTVNGGNWITFGDTADTSISFVNVFNNLMTYEVRVAGVDSLGRQGVFSVASEPYRPDLGPPGQPGKPVFSFGE